MQQIAGDVQTSIASLAGGIGGVFSTALADRAILTLDGGVQPPNTLGSVGLQFVGRAVISTTIFYVLRQWMPETSRNVLFTFLYFSGDSGLISTGIAVSKKVVSAVVGAVGNTSNNSPTKSRESCSCST